MTYLPSNRICKALLPDEAMSCRPFVRDFDWLFNKLRGVITAQESLAMQYNPDERCDIGGLRPFAPSRSHGML